MEFDGWRLGGGMLILLFCCADWASWTRSIAVVAGGSMAEIWVKKRERY